MGTTTIGRNMRLCALCRYWNGAIGSTTIQITIGGNSFSVETNEKHSCFKKGRGMKMSAMQKFPYFMARYDD